MQISSILAKTNDKTLGKKQLTIAVWFPVLMMGVRIPSGTLFWLFGWLLC